MNWVWAAYFHKVVNLAILLWNIPCVCRNNLITKCSPTGKSSHNIICVFILSLDNQFMKPIKLNQIFLEGGSLANYLWHHLLHEERKYGVLIGMLLNSQGTEWWWIWSQRISVRSQILTDAREYTVLALEIKREPFPEVWPALWSPRQEEKSRFLLGNYIHLKF